MAFSFSTTDVLHSLALEQHDLEVRGEVIHYWVMPLTFFRDFPDFFGYLNGEYLIFSVTIPKQYRRILAANVEKISLLKREGKVAYMALGLAEEALYVDRDMATQYWGFRRRFFRNFATYMRESGRADAAFEQEMAMVESYLKQMT